MHCWMADLRTSIVENFVVQQFNKSLTVNKISLTAVDVYLLLTVELPPHQAAIRDKS